MLLEDITKWLTFCCVLGVLTDKAAGDYTTETIYDDSDPDQIETLADTQLHRNVDLEIVRADKEGNTLIPCTRTLAEPSRKVTLRATSFSQAPFMG